MKVFVVRVPLPGSLERGHREIERSGTADGINGLSAPCTWSLGGLSSEYDQLLADEERALRPTGPKEEFCRKLPHRLNILVRERGNESLVETPAELRIKFCRQILG